VRSAASCGAVGGLRMWTGMSECLNMSEFLTSCGFKYTTWGVCLYSSACLRVWIIGFSSKVGSHVHYISKLTSLASAWVIEK